MNVSHLFAEFEIGLEEIDDALWNVYLGPVWLGRFHEAARSSRGWISRIPLAVAKVSSQVRWSLQWRITSGPTASCASQAARVES